MLSEEGVGVEETFFDDEYMEYAQYYVVNVLSNKKTRNSSKRIELITTILTLNGFERL
jgi:hypothetical protein